MEKETRKKRMLTLKEKIEILNWHEQNKVSVRNVATKFEIGKTQAANIIQKKEEIMKKWHECGNNTVKRNFLKTNGLKIDQLTYEWFIKARNKNIPLSGPIVRSKAKDIADTLNIENFKASEGWLEKFRLRHNIAFKCISGEAASVDKEDVTNFAAKVPLIIRGYDAKNIYNADETGLFFRALPNKTLALKKEKCQGGKMSKDRLTVLHCVSMAGEKEKLLVIGKSARPRAFRKLGVNALPVNWQSNKKAWMTCDIMKEWLLQFDRRMGIQKRKILLFLDNAASHPKDLQLTNIKIIFLPPNTTAFCQPLDQGIIKNFKMFYRMMILHTLAQMDTVYSVQNLIKTVDQLDAIYFMTKAWDQVTDTTIQNCFRKATFRFNNDDTPREEYEPEDEIPLAVYAEMLKACNAISNDNIAPEDFVNFDGELAIEDDDVDSPIPLESDDAEVEQVEDADAVLPECKIGSYEDAIIETTHLKQFAKNRDDFHAYELAAQLETYYANKLFEGKNKKQSTLLDYFTKK